MREFKQELFCQETEETTTVSVKLSPLGVTLAFDGSRNFVGDGDMHIELYDGEVRAHVWADEDSEDPTNSISLPVDIGTSKGQVDISELMPGMAVWWEDPEGSTSGIRLVKEVPSDEDFETLESHEVILELTGCQAYLNEIREATAAEINQWLVDSR